VPNNISLGSIRMRVHIGIDIHPVGKSEVLTRGSFWKLSRCAGTIVDVCPYLAPFRRGGLGGVMRLPFQGLMHSSRVRSGKVASSHPSCSIFILL